MYKIAKPVIVKYGISLRNGIEWNGKVMLIQYSITTEKLTRLFLAPILRSLKDDGKCLEANTKYVPEIRLNY